MGLIGSRYSVSYSKAISAGSYLTMVFTTPATASGTIVMSGVIESNLAGTATFAKSASVSAGSTLTASDTNLNSDATSGSVIVGTPTVTTYGTVLETHVRGANNTPIYIGGFPGAEYTLSPSTSYSFKFQALATSTYSAINLYFYKV